MHVSFGEERYDVISVANPGSRRVNYNCALKASTRYRKLSGYVTSRLLPNPVKEFMRCVLVQTRRCSRLTSWSRSKAPVRPWSHSK
jgi:hypothetical protein